MTPAVAQRPGLRPHIVPLAIALVPLVGMACLQFSLAVLAPRIMPALGRSPETYGVLTGMIGFGSVWFYVASHRVVPAFGPLMTLVLGLALAAVGATLIMAGTFPLALIGAFAIGFGYATTTPSGSQVLADFTPKASWGTLFSIRQAGVPIGGMIAGIVTAGMASSMGWQAALMAVAGGCTILALVLLAMPPAYNSSRPLVRFDPLALFALSNISRPLTIVPTIPGLPSLTAAACALAVMHGIVTAYFVVYLHTDLGVPLLEAGKLFALLQAFAILGRVAFGFLADRIGSPMAVLKALSPLSASSALILAVFAPSWPGWVAATAVAAIGLTVGTWNGLFLAEVARIAPPDRVADATTASGVFVFLTYMATPPLFVVLVASFGYRTSWMLVALAPVAALAILTRAARHPPPGAEGGPA